MNYTEYRKAMGFEPESHAPGVTLRDINFGNTPNEGGMATIYLLNETPLMVAWYEYTGCTQQLIERLSEELNAPVEICGIQNSGNGHYRAVLRVDGKFHPNFATPLGKPAKQKKS